MMMEALAIWRRALDQYDEGMLLHKPSDASWSMGQLYGHLVAETSFYLAQIEACLSGDQNKAQQPTPEGIAMLAANEFPDVRIEGPPSNALVQQPESRAQLVVQLDALLDTARTTTAMLQQGSMKGKTAHPGLGYLSAKEWAQFAAMHLRHHLRQKQRIDDFLAAHTPNGAGKKA